MLYLVKKLRPDVLQFLSLIHIYGGEKLYQFWLDQAKEIDTSKVTRYDQAIGDAWGNAISAVKTGQMTKEEAVNDFYDTIESTYPDITVNR